MFECMTYILVGKDKRQGLPGHTSGIFIGYPDNHVSWKVYIVSTKKVVILWDLVFDETHFPGISSANMPTPPLVTIFKDLPEYELYDSSKPINITFSNKLCPSADSDNNSELVEELPEEVGADLPSTPAIRAQQQLLPPLLPHKPS